MTTTSTTWYTAKLEPWLASRQPSPFDDTPPVSAWAIFGERDWHEVPKGHYALPVCDWMIHGDMCGPDDGPQPIAPLIGYVLIARKVPRPGKGGRITGRDALATGRLVTAEGAIGYRDHTPADWLRHEVEDEWHDVDHEYDLDSWCKLPPLHERDDGSYYLEPGHCSWHYTNHWPFPTGEGAERWRRRVAAALLHDIEQEGDRYRALYGQITGKCGFCNALLTDPESRNRGIGPECWKRLRAAVARLTAPEMMP